MATPSTFYGKKNNAKTTITDNPLTAGALTIHFASSTGSKFPSTAFLATLYDAVTYPDPSDDPGMEIVKIDSVSGDIGTVNASGRGFAGTTAVQHANGSAFRLFLMKEHSDQWETAINNLEGWADPNGDSSGSRMLGISDVVANQTPITTIVDLTSLSKAVTIPAGGRRIKITGVASFSNTSGAGCVLQIYEGSTQLQSSRVSCPDSGLDYEAIVTVTIAPTAGAHTYKLRALADTGTGTMVATSTHPAYILIEVI